MKKVIEATNITTREEKANRFASAIKKQSLNYEQNLKDSISIIDLPEELDVNSYILEPKDLCLESLKSIPEQRIAHVLGIPVDLLVEQNESKKNRSSFK